MSQDEEQLLMDVALEADPDAEEELGADDIEAIADEDIKGSRLLLVRRVVESIDLDGQVGGVVQLACTFQPALGARFTSAQLRIRFTLPNGLKVIDLEPRNLSDPNPVEFVLEKKGQLSVKNLPIPVDPSAEIAVSKKYTRYHCMVQGSGDGTGMVRWDFKENPDRRDGIGPEQVLTFTLPVTGPVMGDVIVSARLARPGLGDQIEAIRDMILRRSGERSYNIKFEIPQASRPNLLERFFRVF